MNEYNNELTLILLTHNRKKFLERAVSYYANFPFKLLILDSSKMSNAPLLHKYKEHNVDYIHYHSDAYGDLVKKIKFGVGLVKTDYVLFLADDDFTLLDGIQESLNFLKNNADYGMCHGYSMMYLADAKEVHYFQYAKRISGDYSGDINSRIIDFMAEYHPPFYAVQKTELLTNWFDRIYDDISFEFSEFGHAFHMLNLAKAHVLHTPFMVRELNYPQSEHLTDLKSAMESKSHHPEKRAYFYAFLERLLQEVRTDYPAEQARNLIEQSSHVLVSCLQSENSLQLAELFFSTAESTPQKVDWTFLAKQPITELPFYSAAFFHALAEIDTLIRVMPCGKFQLDNLSKLPTPQNDPYLNLRVSQGHFADELPLIVPRIAVVLHLFYLEQWDDITVLLKNIPNDFDLIVTTTPDNQGRVSDLLTHSYPASKAPLH